MAQGRELQRQFSRRADGAAGGDGLAHRRAAFRPSTGEQQAVATRVGDGCDAGALGVLVGGGYQRRRVGVAAHFKQSTRQEVIGQLHHFGQRLAPPQLQRLVFIPDTRLGDLLLSAALPDLAVQPGVPTRQQRLVGGRRGG